MYSTEEKDLMKSRILEEMTGSECRSLDDILLNDVMGEFPHVSTVYEWLNKNSNYYDPSFSEDYARAREIRTDKLFSEIISISDTPVLGETVKSGLLGDETTTGDMIQHRRLQVDARKWVVARMMPKKYGDKIETTIQGGDVPLQTVDYSKFSSELLEELAKQADVDKSKS